MISSISNLIGNPHGLETGIGRGFIPGSRIIKKIVAIALLSLIRQASAPGIAPAATQIDTPCQVTMLIHPGHAAVSLSCLDELYPLSGFYPFHDEIDFGSVMPNVLEDNAKDVPEAGSTPLNLVNFHPFYLLQHAQRVFSGSSSMQSYSRSTSSSGSRSSKDSVPSGSVIPTLSNKCLSGARSGKLSHPKFQSQMSMGSVLLQVSSLWSNLIPDALAQAMGGNMDISGKIVQEDPEFLEHCETASCLKASVNVTCEKYEELVEMINKMQRAYNVSNTLEICPENKSEAPPFHLLKNNCVDFARKIMDATGVANWKDSLHYTNPPNRLAKILGVAWHYFRWT